MKKTFIFLAIILILTSFLLYFVQLYHNTRENLSRANSNVSALTSQLDTFRTKNNELVSKTENLQYTLAEAKMYNMELVERIRELNVKPKNVVSASEGTITIHTTDTVFLKETDGIFNGEYHDTWTDATFTVKDSILSFDYATKDSLMVVLYGQKEKFSILHPFRKRKTAYYTIAKLTRPNGNLVVKSVQFK